ncbi:MAG: AAA family ATPase [Parcubacteria group bacterium]|nr:AAA family ATPase [Parcubacteria group bacterium]
MTMRENENAEKKMKKIFGFAGEMASGKTTAAEYVLKKCDGVSYRFSDPLRDVLARIGLPNTRENLQILSTSLRQNFGEDVLAKIVFEDVKNTKNPCIVIDGIRRPDDIKYLRTLREFILIYIRTDLNNRYSRLAKRQENSDDFGKTLEEFEKEQKQEAEAKIRELEPSADIVIENNGTLEEFYKKICFYADTVVS